MATDDKTLTESAAELANQAKALAYAATIAVQASGAVSEAAHAGGGEPFLVTGLTVFVLACFVGYYVVWRVTPALHSPLMGITNAISSVIVVGAIIALGAEGASGFSRFLAFLAVTLASVNIFGGFIITRRMLSMFRKKRVTMRRILSSFVLLLSLAAQAHAQETRLTHESVYHPRDANGNTALRLYRLGDMLKKDPNTGAMSGLTYDLVSAIGRELGLKVEWTEETGWGTFAQGLDSGRYDMMCSMGRQSGDRAKAALLTRPVAFNAMYAFARADDDRFDGGLQTLNDPAAAIAVVEGDPTQDIRARR